VVVLAAHYWNSNADLMRDVSRLGYLGNDASMVIDVTYGRGNFWTKYRPPWLVKCDLRPLPKLDFAGVDFRNLPFSDDSADVVVMDPPYRLNGTPDQGDFDDRYGIQETMSWQQRMAMIHDGIKDCARVVAPGGYFLLKCQDQVCSGQVRWQTIYFAQQANACGLTLVDRFDMLPKSPRPQPGGRRQVHAHGRPSTLLVFQKRKKK
jgi:SAM-dependent methyltransferase